MFPRPFPEEIAGKMADAQRYSDGIFLCVVILTASFSGKCLVSEERNKF